MTKWNEKTEELRKYHSDILSEHKEPYFVIKTTVRFKNQQCVVFFKSELSKGDAFLELVDSSLNPGVDRTLYRYVYNNFWESEYELVEGYSDKYYVPVEELHVIPKKEAFVETEQRKKIFLPGATNNYEIKLESILDKNAAVLTVRDLIAIIHRRPVSNHNDLNEFLKQV
jgi:hypothetical protein